MLIQWLLSIYAKKINYNIEILIVIEGSRDRTPVGNNSVLL